MSGPRFAVFDLDLTITRYPTWRNYIRYVNRRRPLTVADAVVRTGIAALRFKAGRQERTEVKEAALRAGLAGRRRDELEAAAEGFADEVMARGLRLRARSVIEGHEARGDEVILASAAVDLVAEPICRRLGIETCISTPMAWEGGEGGEVLADHFGGPNCYDAEKARRVRAHVAAADGTMVAMYSDHVTDLALLREAERGVAVNPSPRLRVAAAEHGLEVQDWDASSSEEGAGGTA